MEVLTTATSLGIMASLGLTLALILVVASRKFHVYEDPRIDAVDEMLPQSNCGACGVPGCRAFSEQLITGESAPGQCTVSTPETIANIAGFLDVEEGNIEKRVARLACAGGSNVAKQRVSYKGLTSCQAASLVAGGGKGCTWGCLGLGDCARVCEFDAIVMNPFGLPIVDAEKCVACNDCIEICPKDLFSLEPVHDKLFVACKNLVFGDPAEEECDVACNGCGLCAMDSPDQLVTMKDHLAIIDPERMDLATQKIIQRCPTGAIVWIEEGERVIKGRKAKKIVRKTSLPVG